MKEYETIAIEKLKPYENNARTHSEDQIEMIMNSLREFGFVAPCIIDENDMILVGHGRIEAAKRLGIKEVPYRRITHLTDDQKKAYILADNKLSDLSGWDLDLLDVELSNIDLDMSEFGFDDISVDDFGTDFSLPEGDKPPFKQLTFTLATEQATQIEEILKFAKSNGIADYYDNYGNENGNGNVLFGVVKEWEKLKA